MRPSDRFLRTVAYASASRRAAFHAAVGFSYQYVFKYDDGDFHVKIVADINQTKAIITRSVVSDGNVEVDTHEASYEKDGPIYPFDTVGCPVDCYIYKFDEFNCKGERELRHYFNKTPFDAGDGPTYLIGLADHEYNSIEFISPCTRTP